MGMTDWQRRAEHRDWQRKLVLRAAGIVPRYFANFENYVAMFRTMEEADLVLIGLSGLNSRSEKIDYIKLVGGCYQPGFVPKQSLPKRGKGARRQRARKF